MEWMYGGLLSGRRLRFSLISVQAQQDVLQVEVLDWEGPAMDVEGGAVIKIFQKELLMQCGRHQNDLQFWMLGKEISQHDQ